jgi:hypothetical protein
MYVSFLWEARHTSGGGGRGRRRRFYGGSCLNRLIEPFISFLIGSLSLFLEVLVYEVSMSLE